MVDIQLTTSISTKFFYDKRVFKRFNSILDKIVNNPGVSLTTLFESGADTVGIWRFLKNKKFNHVDIMNGYCDATKKSIKKIYSLTPSNEVYIIQDTSEINLSSIKASEQLGYLNDNQAFRFLKQSKDDPSISMDESVAKFKKLVDKGVLLHSCLACTVDGEPLGFTYQEQIVRDFQNAGVRRSGIKKIEEKESFKWIKSVNQTLKLNL